MKPKVKFTNVSKSYVFYKKQIHKLVDLVRVNKTSKDFYALHDISFEVAPGESIGVIGINGSGKSTLSNLLSEVVEPTSGSIELDGESSLIAISAGLNNNLNGYENIELKCMMLGIGKKEIKEITPKIIDFAEIGDFITQPVKNYSSGMKSRLGFAISAYTNPDIIIIDEALSVGDSTFYKKCLNKINEFKEEGKTIFFISHSIGQVRSFSDRVMWLHFGELVDFGDSTAVLEKYKEFISWFNELDEKEKKEYRKEKLQEQFHRIKKSRSNSVPSSRRKKVLSKILSAFLVGFLLTLGTIQLFDPKILSHIHLSFPSKDKKSDNLDKSSEAPVTEQIDKDGYIAAANVALFSDEKLENEEFPLGFGDEIYVESKTEDIINIRIDNKDYFMESKDVATTKKKVNTEKLTDFLVFLPEIFSESYSYYMAFMDSEYNDIKNKLLELTDENTDQFGHKYLEYSYDKVTYYFDNDNISNAIKINGINSDSNEIEYLIDNATVANADSQLYLIYTEEYKIILNLEDESMKLEKL
ncbi:ATP-binding cassette domain-containing protein [Rossellomorea marisflavi]|uniref:ATP-binding cassette domain-containing protein n=1 Tax=Rossellomorea marisflavi TaxID=189381 RepID=A0A5D4RRZ1_9BACI|nr:ATP-binding cassette domain-containing protein [Rossellomorea marisflavi]